MDREKLRSIRCGDVWDAAAEKARSEGVTMSGLIREWLTDYVTGTKRASETDQAALAKRVTDALSLAGITGVHVDLSDARISAG